MASHWRCYKNTRLEQNHIHAPPLLFSGHAPLSFCCLSLSPSNLLRSYRPQDFHKSFSSPWNVSFSLINQNLFFLQDLAGGYFTEAFPGLLRMGQVKYPKSKLFSFPTLTVYLNFTFSSIITWLTYILVWKRELQTQNSFCPACHWFIGSESRIS